MSQIVRTLAEANHPYDVVSVAIGWAARGLVKERTQNRPEIKPDGRLTNTDKIAADIAKKEEAYAAEVGEGKIPHMAVLTDAVVINMADGAVETFEGEDVSDHLWGYLKSLFDHDAHACPWPEHAGQEWPTEHPVLLFGFDVSICLRIMAMGVIAKGGQIPVGLWRRNKWALDPFEECVTYELRHKKVSYERVFELAGVKVDPKNYSGGRFVPNVNPGFDARTTEKVVRNFGLAGW